MLLLLRLRLIILVTGVAALLLVLPTPPVWGHARLLRSSPSAGSMLSPAPKIVRLWFNEELDTQRSTVSVWNAQGKQVDAGKGGVDLNDLDRASMRTTLKPLSPGRYTVRWRAVSADDLNSARGEFHFTVKATQ